MSLSNEVEIVVTGAYRAGPAFTKANEDQDKLKAKAKESSVSVEALSAEFRRASTMTDDFGNRMSSASSMSEFLDGKLAKLRGEARTMGEEFNKTGNIDLWKHIKDNKGAQDSIGKVRKDMTQALEQAGQEGGQSMFKEISSMASEGMSALGPVIVGVLVVAAPLIAGALDAALLAGVGGGALALGIASQFKDPRVQAAWSQTLDGIKGQLAARSAVLAQPLAEAIRTVGGGVNDLFGHIDFAKLVRPLQEVASGISGMLSNIGPGLSDALSGALPIFRELGRALPMIGSAISDALSSMSQGSKGAAEALRTVVLVLVGAIVAGGKMIEWLSQGYEKIVAFGDAASGLSHRLFENVPILGSLANAAHSLFDTIKGGADDTEHLARSFTAAAADASLTQDQLDALAGQITTVTQNANTLAAAMVSKVFTATMNVDEASLHWNESLTQLGSTLSQNGLAIDKHTHQLQDASKAGEENRQAILSAVSANMQQYQANVAAGLSADDAAAAYDRNTQALERQLQKAGYTKDQIQNLIGKYEAIPDTVNTNIAMQGLTDAINGLADLIAKINGIERNVVVDIWANDHTQGTLGGRTNPLGFHEGHGRASGGVWGGWTTINEQGHEMIRLPQGSMVYSQPDAERMAGAASAAGARGGGPLTMHFAGNTDDEGAQMIQRLFRGNKVTLYDSTGTPVTIN